MKKELLKVKLKRLSWAGLFGFLFVGLSLIPMFVFVFIEAGMFKDVEHMDFNSIGIGAWIFNVALLIFTMKAIRKPTEWIDKVFFAPRLEDFDAQVKMITEKITTLRLNKLEERDTILNSRIEIVEELRKLPYNISNAELLRSVSARLNDIHANEVKNKNVIDIRDAELSKRDYKKFRKEITGSVKKVKISKINAIKLKDIEEILTGTQAKEQALIQEEHQRALELARAGAAQTVIADPRPTINSTPMLANEVFTEEARTLPNNSEKNGKIDLEEFKF